MQVDAYTVSRLGETTTWPRPPISWESVQKVSENFLQAFQKVHKRIDFLPIASEKFTAKPRLAKALRLNSRRKISKVSW
jgi:hypothetical protein